MAIDREGRDADVVHGRVVVVGQGYVGLPVAMRAVEVGYSVVGLDLDARRVGELNAGRSYVGDVSDEELAAALASGRYIATDNYADAVGFDYAVITVPTPLRETLPDLSFIESSATSLAPLLSAGATVVLESTTYPGTTEEVLVPILEAGSGLVAGRDFHVGYSPERIDPGNSRYGFQETPKVVSGIDDESLASVQRLYDSLVRSTVVAKGTREAELSKLIENTFRHVNIALMNELAIFARQLGINIWDAIEAASSKPFGFMRFTPGPGVGGHCLPVDPSYLSWQVRRKLGSNFRFIELANDINEHMPHYVVNRSAEVLNKFRKPLGGSKVLVLGLAYKRDTNDLRESPALVIVDLLNEAGAEVSAIDNWVDEHGWPERCTRVSWSDQIVTKHDLVIVVSDHSDIPYERLVGHGVPVLDTRNVVPGSGVETL